MARIPTANSAARTPGCVRRVREVQQRELAFDEPVDGMSATDRFKQRLAGLRRWNVALTLLHLAQTVVIVLLAGDLAITVTSSIPEGPPGTAAAAPEALFDVPIGWAVAVFRRGLPAPGTARPPADRDGVAPHLRT
jgi:hypothetical protein